ncbi:MAG TPA: hypothetical protein VLA24_11490 [Pseudomonadales bacterium]|nr:hypothetical protein [Pseudomonadales bacterium]
MNKEQLVNRCLATASVERLAGNEYMATLLEECAEVMCEGQSC